MSIVNTLALESNRQIKINFDGGDLSSDAGLLLIKEFISKLGIDTLLEKAFKTNAPVFKSVLEKDALASQPTVSRFFNRMDEDTLNQFLAIARVLRRKIYSVQMPQAVILDPVSYTHLRHHPLHQPFRFHSRQSSTLLKINPHLIPDRKL